MADSSPRQLDLERTLADVATAAAVDAGEPCPCQTEALALVDGTLDDESAARVEAHLAGCASCRGAAIDYSRARIGSGSGVLRRVPRRVWLAAAAILVVAIGLGLMLLTQARSPEVEVAMRFAVTRGDETFKVGDGFHLEVRPRSSAHLYAALLYEVDGTCTSLAPADPRLGSPVKLDAGLDRRLPEAPSVFVLADHPGDVSLIWIAARKPLAPGQWAAFLEKLNRENSASLVREFVTRDRDTSASMSFFTIVR